MGSSERRNYSRPSLLHDRLLAWITEYQSINFHGQSARNSESVLTCLLTPGLSPVGLPEGSKVQQVGFFLGGVLL